MLIRPAAPCDAQAIEYLVQSLSAYYLQDTHASLPAWFADTLTMPAFEQRLASADYNNYVCCKGDTIVAYLALKNGNHIYHLFVAKAHHGQGIARALWQHVLQPHPAKRYTVRSSLFAVPIYQRFGFIVCEPVIVKDGIGYQPMQLTA